ncbi:MAG: hypothetical protein JNJ54_03465 [Myxococcaceae bacterium]|nr:hypothetical protein [Myxococcaceae bacterium]
MTPEELLLLEQVVSAHRERTVDGVIKSHPAWHDLDAAGRSAAFDETLRQRALERAGDPAGQSSTVKAVLARLAR